jgi:hypothetical protein
MSAPPNATNGTKREPFCWLPKRQLRKIAEVFAEGKIGTLVAARSVFLALSEIASDKQSDIFTAATSYIAQRAGVALKTARRMIKIFKQLGFLKVQPRSANGLKIASEYTLIRSNASMGLIYPSLSKDPETRLPTIEESDEQFREGTARKGEAEVLATDENNTVIHQRTGEQFNRRTREFEW